MVCGLCRCYQEVFGIRAGGGYPLILSLNRYELLLAGQGGLGIIFNADTFTPAQKNTFSLPSDLAAASQKPQTLNHKP